MSKPRKSRGIRASEEGLNQVRQRMAEQEKADNKKGWTQDDLAEKSGASLSTVKRFLGRKRVDKNYAIWITQALGFELMEIIEQNDSNSPSKSSEPDYISTFLDNPFVPKAGRVDDPQLFFNREREIKRIFEILNSGSSVAVIGEEAIGKSSLLCAICRQADGFQSLRKPIYLDLNEIRDEDDFYSALCHEANIIESKGYRLTRELRSHRLLLALDNVGKITCEGFSRQVRDQLRGLAEGRDAPLRLILAATQSLDSLFEDSLEEDKTSPLAGICQEERLEAWDEKTSRALIKSRLAFTNVQFSEEEISQLVQESGGYPQKLMQLCYQTFSQYLKGVQ